MTPFLLASSLISAHYHSSVPCAPSDVQTVRALDPPVFSFSFLSLSFSLINSSVDQLTGGPCKTSQRVALLVVLSVSLSSPFLDLYYILLNSNSSTRSQSSGTGECYPLLRPLPSGMDSVHPRIVWV